MKNLRLYFFMILQTWRSIKCEGEDETEEPVSAVSFDHDTVQTNFVDPYSFDYDRTTKKMGSTKSAKLLRTEDTGISLGGHELELKECKDALNQFELEKPFTIRLINLVLSNAKLKEDGDLLHGSISLSGTKEQFEELKQYGNGKITMRQIDAILTDVMTPSFDILGEVLSLIDHLQMVIYQYGGIIAGLFATIAILLSIKLVNWSIGKVVIIGFSIVLLISYFMIWHQLIKEAEIKRFVEARKHTQPPIQCEPEKMTSWDRILTYFKDGDQCFEYYKVIDFNPYHEVTPLDALIELFGKFLLQPAGRFGSGISNLIDNSTKHLSFPMSWIVTIFLYMGVIGFAIVLPFSIFGGGFGLSFGPFFKLSLGSGQSNHNNQQQQQQQIQQQPQPIVERREAITVILQVNSTEGQKQSLTSAMMVPLSIEDQRLSTAGGDSKSTKRDVDGENSVGSDKKCCKDTSSSSNPHVEEILDLKDESTKTKNRPERDEKGDGDY